MSASVSEFAPFKRGVVALAAFIILTHAVLIYGGYWNSDEYFHFARYHTIGLRYLGFRLLHDSPRPVSEITLYVYSVAVEWAGKPLIPPFLAILWVTLIGGAVAAARLTSLGTSLSRLTLGLSLVAMFLLGHGISEMFYWPMAASAYLPALAGITVAAFQIIDGGTATPRGRLICCTGISVAALCVEPGMFVAFGFSVAMALMTVPSLLHGGRENDSGPIVWWLVPLLISGGVLACALMFRVGNATAEPGQSATYFHHFLPGVSRTLELLPTELAFGDAPDSASKKAAILMIKILAFLGFYGVLHEAPTKVCSRRHSSAFAIGLCTSIVLTMLASLYQYGAWGMTRQRTWLQCLLLVLLLVMAHLATLRWRMPARVAAVAGPICLIAAMGIGMAPRTVGLLNDYAMLPRIRNEQRQTWASGKNSSTDSMRLVLPPAGRVLDTLQWRTGHFTMTDNLLETPWYIGGVLDYFDKKSVDIVLGQIPRPETKDGM
jgi:hypothetical protein